MAYLASLAVLIGMSLLLLGWGTVLYNALVRLQNACDETWSETEIELRRRHELTSKLVDCIQGHTRQERDVLERVTKARQTAASNNDSPALRAHDENLLAAGMRQVIALSEDFPDLKASREFLDLQHDLSGTEGRLDRARRSYNASVRDLNNRVDAFPSNIAAGVFAIQRREYFEIEDPAALKSTPTNF
jgi:LemA protein